MKLDQIFQFNATPFFNNVHLQNTHSRYRNSNINLHAPVPANAPALAVDQKIWKVFMGLAHEGDRHITIHIGNDYGLAEMLDCTDNSKQYALVWNSNDTFYFSACETDENDIAQNYSTKRNGTILFSALLAYMMGTNPDVSSAVNELVPDVEFLEDDPIWQDPEKCEDTSVKCCAVSNYMYYTVKNHLMTDDVNRLYLDTFKEKKACALESFYKPLGDFEEVNFSETTSKSSTDYVGMYNLNPSRVFTEEEQNLIPVMSESFQWNDWITEVARDIQESSSFEKPFRTVLLGGPAGTGKSDGSMAIASLLGRPYVSITCDPDMDFQELLGSTTYNTAADKSSSIVELPSVTDIEFNFEESFEKLFNRKPTKFDEKTDCYQKLFDLLQRKNETEKDIIFAKSPLLRAIENGYVVEVKEPTVIKRNSVLVKLNGTFDSSGTITLDNGETITKHPETIIIYTTNYDYDGCKPMQQSVLSRIDIIRDISLPSHQIMVERAMARTGCQDKNAISKMASAIEKINSYCNNNDIRDGVCGMRELINWIMKSMLLEMRSNSKCDSLSDLNVCRASHSTVLAHVSQSYEDRNTIITGAFKTLYPDKLVNETREMYEMGKC